jgi:GNAT superfamily N-acetyltransferase
MSDGETTVAIRRLDPKHATAVVDCFRRVYGESYANDLFYDPAALAAAMQAGSIGSVGAIDSAGVVLGHMAMSLQPDASVVELGNTVVDPSARGGGLAWKVGAELSTWCRELGYQGFLHYPTTDHHIMQRQSVQAGFETGLMLGYIPSETHGQVNDEGGATPRKRQAATIVYEPYGSGAPFEGYLPAEYWDLLNELVAPTGLPRSWRVSTAEAEGAGELRLRRFDKRGLHRLEVSAVGRTLTEALARVDRSAEPCLQIDFSLSDLAVGEGIQLARAQGFSFCGWLPGYRTGDVLRLQRVLDSETNLEPRLENPVALRLLSDYRADR